MARLLLHLRSSYQSMGFLGCPGDRKEFEMELVMGGLLIGISGMVILLIIATWKDTAPHQADRHPSTRRA